nr:uncharacterized mitochondrial protein AtMg00810-like [Nicotiana tomentosiformis]
MAISLFSKGLSISAASSSTSAPLVCKLQKSLYGLRQASRQWYVKLSHALCSRGYSYSFNDYSLFVKGSPRSFTALAVYIDDIILTGNDANEISALKQFLHAQFKIKDLGQLRYFLGIEISYFPSGLLLNRKKFVSDLFSEYKYEDVSPVACPLELYEKLSADSGEVLDKPESFRSLVGKLLFLTHTRPDICFAVQHLSEFLKCPRVPHMSDALHILRYLKGTLDIGFFYSNDSDLTVSAYRDSDCSACVDTRRSVTGFCSLLGESLIGWKSKKQPVVSLSSAEAEYRAISKVVAELTWMVRLLSDLHVPVSLPIFVFCDNQVAIHIAKNPVIHKCTKHIEVDFHFIRSKLGEGLIHLDHVSTFKQLADILTKPLPSRVIINSFPS